VEMAEKFPQDPVFAAVGLHPIHLTDHRWDSQKYLTLAQNKKVKAIGETGLDFYHNQKTISRQKEVFLAHAKIAQKLNKPLILHCRPSKQDSSDAYLELYTLVKKHQINKGVLHCYVGDSTMAQKFVNLGFYISFTGIITYKNAGPALMETVKQTPLNRILLETDCPYLSPEPKRTSRNLPVNVKYIGQKVAEIKKINYNKVIKTTDYNASKLFNKL